MISPAMTIAAMTSAWLFRLFLAGGLILLGWLLYRAGTRFVLRQVDRRSQSAGLFSRGKPAILYFTTPDCKPCKTVQRPAIQRVQSRLGDALQVVEVDALQHPDLAEKWHVMSVPTTFIIDSQGHPRQVNYGVASADKLFEQLAKLEPALN